jgi:hypothetical protein
MWSDTCNKLKKKSRQSQWFALCQCLVLLFITGSFFSYGPFFFPEDGGRRFLSGVGKYIPDYIASYPTQKSIRKEWMQVQNSMYGKIDVTGR